MTETQYLGLISNRIQTTNDKLDDVIMYEEIMLHDNTTIIKQQQTLISGDIEINNKLEELEKTNTMVIMILAMTLTYTFIRSCFRC